MPTANERYFDSQLRHAVGVRRYTAGQAKKILAMIEEIDAETVRLLRRRLARVVRRRDLDSEVLRVLMDEVVTLRNRGIRSSFDDVRTEARQFAASEVEFEGRLIRAAIPIEVTLGTVTADRIAAVVTSKPFQGALLRDWVGGFVRSDRVRLERTIKQGIAEGLGVDDIVRRVIGTRRAGYSDGILAVSRREAEALVRTTINHVSNGARELVWEENEDILLGLRWEATLDGRTSPICRARDGAIAPVGGKPVPKGSRKLEPPGARPPAHINCRSVMIAVLDGEAEIFAGLDRQSAVGPVPSDTTYNEWLKRQPKGFQEEVLGKKKAALFRKGGLSLDKYTDRRGNELTLNELRATYPEAWEEAGL